MVHGQLLQYKAELLELGPDIDGCISKVDDSIRAASREFTGDNVLVTADVLSQQLLEVESEDRC